MNTIANIKPVSSLGKTKKLNLSINRNAERVTMTEITKEVRAYHDESYEEKAYRQITKSQFLKGYADSDTIYDS